MNTDDGNKPFFKIASDSENPFAKMNDEAYETATILCSGLKSFARQLAPLLDGKYLIVSPTGQVRVGDFVMLQPTEPMLKARGNA